jgi:hypothetical protein
MGVAMVAQDDQLAKDALYAWGKWARRDGLSKLGIVEPSLVRRGKSHEGDYPYEEKIDSMLANLMKGSGEYELSAKVAVKYYVARKEDGTTLSLDEIAQLLKCGKGKVREAHKFALGYMSGLIDLGLIQ